MAPGRLAQQALIIIGVELEQDDAAVPRKEIEDDGQPGAGLMGIGAAIWVQAARPDLVRRA